MSTATRTFDARQWRQVAAITAGAIGVFCFLRFLPTGTNLNHMDFRVNARNSIEFCDPLNPQFIPVVAVASPVTLTLTPGTAPVANEPAQYSLVLRTAKGKPIEAPDLVLAHTKLLHLLIVDPTLTDYQHVHPEPGRQRGEWTFSFTPRLSGRYRVFADFTPAVTGRSLYANADVIVTAGPATGNEATSVAAAPAGNSWRVEKSGYIFELQPSSETVRAGRVVDLKFLVTRVGGGPVPMEPVMGAFAHLVAFDETRSGFAHLHPMEVDLLQPPDSVHPALSFKITIPRAGRYVIWSQVNLEGHEVFAPFWFDVKT